MSAPPQPHDDAVHTDPDNTNRPANQEPPYLFGYDIDALINPPSQPQSRPGSHQHSPDPTNESYFYDAFHPTPSPQPTSFLDSILNPIESQNHQSFGYHVHDSPPRRRQPSPIVSIQSSMPVTGERHGRSARLPNGYVDLTGLSESPDESRRPRRQSPTPGPSAKRRKQNDGMTAKQASLTPEATVEEVDLSEDKQTVHGVLQKQREEAVKAQKPEVTSTTFSTFTCVICMDIPTDLTATACGHLFCHTCLMEALIAGENRAAPGEPKRSQCPVCRKFINRTKASDIIPLLLKKGLATQPRKKAPVATAAPKVTS